MKMIDKNSFQFCVFKNQAKILLLENGYKLKDFENIASCGIDTIVWDLLRVGIDTRQKGYDTTNLEVLASAIAHKKHYEVLGLD